MIFPYDGTELLTANGGNGDVDNDGDMDADDVTYLFNYCMGGVAPLGAWRFDFMP